MPLPPQQARVASSGLSNWWWIDAAVGAGGDQHVAKLTIEETPEADKMYEHLGKDAATPELKAFAVDLVAHENALRDWIKSEVDGKSDGAERSSPISNATGSQEKTRLPLGRSERSPAETSSSWFSRSSTPRTPPTRQPRR
jgi:hypothetical protein